MTTQQSDGHALLRPSNAGKDGRSMSTTSMMSGRTGQSYATAVAPGSFSSELRSTTSRTDLGRPDYVSRPSFDQIQEETRTSSEQRQAELQDQIEKETKIKIGSENMLEALNTKNAKAVKEQKARVEAELNSSNRKLGKLKLDLEAEIQRSKETLEQAHSGGSRLSYLFRNAPSRSPSRQPMENEDIELETESPTFILSEILQALEVDDLQPEYYVERANSLVELFKRHPTLKYDLAWSIFGLRMQTMLLSGSREVVAAAYRVMRYAITDRRSLQTIRALHTDYLVILSLVKESKASVEREQALKFVRAFLDVKDGVKEISRAVVRIIVAVAEHSEDRLRNICILTLAEILVRDPELLVFSGGMGTLTDVLGDGLYHGSEAIAGAFLYLLDMPHRRKYLRSGHEIGQPFAAFTEGSSLHGHPHEERLKANAKVIAALLRSWPGFMTLCLNNFLAIRSLVSSLYIAIEHVRSVLLELLFDILRIKPPSWSSSFLAGRRLTTYGRVTNLMSEGKKKTSAAGEAEDESNKWNLVDHYVAALLAVLLHVGLVPALLYAEEEPITPALKRKTTLLLGEVLKMANELLPPAWSAGLQVLPDLIRSATQFGIEDRFIATGTIYQVDSVNRTLFRSGHTSLSTFKVSSLTDSEIAPRVTDSYKPSAQMDEQQFRNLAVETGVLTHSNYLKWRWDVIQQVMEGPLLNPKRLDEADRSMRFLHRIQKFYRPFGYRFPDIKNTKPNQRYVRVGCAFVKALLQTSQGVKYLAESKLIRQLAECLSHFDRMSGLTSENPLFTSERLAETLTGGYFAMLGEMTKEPKGLQILERWKVINMFYHIVELRGRDDLITLLITHMDYTIDGHLRIIISKAMTSCSKDIRIYATRLLRKYATKSVQTTDPNGPGSGIAEWAIRLLVTQLYDPEIEVCEVAIKILEEACNQTQSLEYVVKCRPALDHLGEIGAPLLLRFLSTSVGYHYLDGLDYITREMDDWFLGRNDSYVALIEASFARALADVSEKAAAGTGPPTSVVLAGVYPNPEETAVGGERQESGHVPPHFYRELTRTKEGCRLLEQKGHFDEFAATICDFGMEEDDPETITKLKGCLWAVGNVGSMELGAPFLEKSDVVKWIVRIAEGSNVMSVRGTAFFVLGLISRSLHGQEILLEYGWDGVVNEMGLGLGLCLPLDLTRLFSIQPWTASQKGDTRLPPQPLDASEPVPAVTDDDPVNARILKLTADLGNTVLAKKAASDLHTIKARRAPGFQQPALFHKVMAVLESHHFRLPICRFVIDLFDKSVLRRIVLDEEDDEDGRQGGAGGAGDADGASESGSESGSEVSGDEEEGDGDGQDAGEGETTLVGGTKEGVDGDGDGDGEVVSAPMAAAPAPAGDGKWGMAFRRAGMF